MSVVEKYKSNQIIMGKEWKWGSRVMLCCCRVLIQTVIVACISVAPVSFAQEPDPELAQEEDKEMRVSFTAIALTQIPYEKVYYRHGEEFIEIQWRNGMRTFPYSLSKAKVFEVYIDQDDPENPYKLVGKAPLVSGTNKMLYFFAHNASQQKEKLPISLYGIDDSESAFPESSYRFINFTSVPLIVDFNKKRFYVKPNKPTVQKVNLSKPGEFTPFVVRDNKGKVLGGTRLFSHAANREMVLIFKPQKGAKRMDIRYFSD